ncbi:MAG: acetyltransferase [Desulforhopalus sp.]
MHIDIFNGDADGIFSLHQYRLEKPQPRARRITGVKRDIQLLDRVKDVAGKILTVFDVSLDSNRLPLELILANNNSVVYFDHHFAGDIPQTPALKTFIEQSPDTCTSLIVNDKLAGKHRLWAICGAFGDNLHDSAQTLAKTIGLSEKKTRQLQELGELFNYNGYGTTLSDLHFHPGKLYDAIFPYQSPFDFLENSSQLQDLREGYAEDLEQAMKQNPLDIRGNNRIYRFPDTPWARRVTGVFSNLKARERTKGAHSVISENDDSTLRISVRAPLDNKRGADTLCKLFPTGGGRAAAAGINSLPADQLELFIEKFLEYYPS